MKYTKVYCPSCGGNAGNCAEGTLPYRGRCRYCNKIVYYNPQTKETKIIKKPMRETSSGCIFY